MAPIPTIPSATSVVDYLNTKKQDSSFGARKKLYTDLGFDKRLGDFVGGANQNLALLKELQRSDNAATTVPSAGAPTETPVVGNTEAPKFNLTKPSVGGFDIGKTQTTTPMTSKGLLESLGFKDIPAPAPTPTATETITETTRAPEPPVDTAPGMGQPKTQTEDIQVVDTQTKDLTGLSASTIYPDIFGDKTRDDNEGDFINRWLNSAEGKLFLDRQQLEGMTDEAKAESLKQELETKYKSEKESLEQKLAENGLAFSGIRATKVKALADALAASELEVDRELASKLLDANLDLREAILKGVADLAKEADAGRKEAIQQLNAIGYAVVNGQLVPTLSALSGERAQRSLEMSERRLELAEEAARKPSGNKLTLSEATTRGLPSYLVGTSEEEVANSFYDKKPPAWFSRKVKEENSGKDMSADAIQKLWDTQSKNYQSGIKDSENHKKAAQFFGAFPGADPAVADEYANRVDFYINGGYTYAEAIDKVVKEVNKVLKKNGQPQIKI